MFVLRYMWVCCFVLPVAVWAQERVATGGLQHQADWSALSNMIHKTAGDTAVLRVDVDAMKACNAKGMMHAPGVEGADEQGCVKAAGSSKFVTVSNNATAYRHANSGVTCPTGTVVVGGGGSCINLHASTGDMRMPTSSPWGNGWFVQCDTSSKRDTRAHVWAICAVE